MENWSFGISMTVVGMGGTFLTLAILILVVNLIKKAFPLPEVHAHPERHKK
jgi:Na+-transporting methylmalonyl-CoA/oxaloacetate decarboxylase gamma subunit